jgi:hypothetical protein
MVNGDHDDDTEHPRWWEAVSIRHDLNSVHLVAGRATGSAGGNRRARPAAGRGWTEEHTRPTGRRVGV